VSRRRLDQELVRRGLASSPDEARSAVSAGRVVVAGRHVRSPRSLVGPGDAVSLLEPSSPFVSRGGEKLDAALARFEVDVRDLDCLDAGASTGGFTDRLLRGGAARVVGVDVGYGVLDWRLRTDPRVVVLERTNVRDLRSGAMPFRPALVVADLSFISLSAVVPILVEVSDDRSDLILLVKPQFEADRHEVAPGGVVREPAVWRRCLLQVLAAAETAGAAPVAAMASPVVGPAGNVEFFVHAAKGSAAPIAVVDLDPVIDEGRRIGGAR
jgi:23S rRNA (cytidine1920-2'-O)/16S rRNA (cytidine1409-2'-O)-methyltransferase